MAAEASTADMAVSHSNPDHVVDGEEKQVRLGGFQRV
jgi:hypothetical protein